MKGLGGFFCNVSNVCNQFGNLCIHLGPTLLLINMKNGVIMDSYKFNIYLPVKNVWVRSSASIHLIDLSLCWQS